MISIVYAVPVGGKHEHQFVDGRNCARHIEMNNFNLMTGVPFPNAEYESKMRAMRERGWSMGWKDELKQKKD